MALEARGNGVKRCQIGALKPGNSDLIVVALVINKPDPRKVVMKKDGGERWVSTFTLRDSPSDMINLTIWSSGEEAAKLKAEFKVGMVVEVVKPKVMSREVVGGRDSAFNPQVTSPFQLSFQEGRSMLCPHLPDAPHLTKLLNVPSKASSTFLSISDIITNSGALKGHFVDMLVAVRKVGEVKRFTNKQDGQERGVREVRLFDQTADSLLLKLWDSELLQMADDWLPREVILFLADARIDWDDYRSSFVLTATSKTVITVNPDTVEAGALMRYAQLADFSSLARLDQFVTSVPLNSFTRTVNVVSVQEMQENLVSASEALVPVLLYGFLTNLDLDSDDAVSLRCGRCSGPMTVGNGGEVCSSFDCKDFNVSGPERMLPSQQYRLKADVSDETGTLSGIRVSSSFLIKNLGPAAEFARLSGETKTAYKWRWFLKPLKLSLALLLPTAEHNYSAGMLADAAEVGLQELTAKMPAPSL